MKKSKIKKLYSSLIISIIVVFSMISGTVFAADISERYSFDSSIADEAFEYGTIYDAKTFPNQLSAGIAETYKDLLENLKNDEYYENGYSDEAYKAILLKQIREIEPTYSSDNLDDIKIHWLQVKTDYAIDINNLTVLETLKKNNEGSYTWNNDFYNNWHLLCLAWGRSIESTKVIFNKATYEYATPSMAFIMNTQADGKDLKNATLYEYLTGADKNVDLSKMESSKWGMLGQYFATYQQFSMWMQQKGSKGNFDDEKIHNENTSFLNQYKLAKTGDTIPSNVIANMTSYAGIGEYKLEIIDFNSTKLGIVKVNSKIIGGNELKENLKIKYKLSNNDSNSIENYWVLRDFNVNDLDKIKFVSEKARDINGDGDLNKEDVTLINEAVVDREKLNSDQENAADIDGDGKLTFFDSMLLERWIEGIDDIALSSESDVTEGDLIVYKIEDGVNKQDISEVSLVYKEKIGNENNTNDIGQEQTDLNMLANEYENRIREIAELDKDGNFIYESIMHECENGNETKNEEFMFPKIDENKINKSLGDSIVASYDKENDNFLISGLKMGGASNISTSLQHSDGSIDTYDFAKIDDLIITAQIDGKSVDLEQGKDWQFIYNGYAEGTSIAPPAGEEFSIVVKRLDGMTEITGITYNFKYLVAVANYYYFSEGKTSASTTAQEQAMIDNTARWYESISVKLTLDNTYINIKKVVKDGDDNELSADEVAKLIGEDQYATFKVTVDGVEREVRVKAGTTERVGPFALTDGSEVKYSVEEINDKNNWEIVSIDNSSGTLKKGKTIEAVVATNKLKKHDGKLKITKKVDIALTENKEFKFKVNIEKANGEIQVIPVTIEIETGKKEASSEEITIDWYGDKAPKYSVKEEEDSEYTLDFITNEIGTLQEGSTIFATAHNEKNTSEPVQLIIRKDTDVPTEDTFNFRIWTTGAINNLGGSEEKAVLINGLKSGVDYTFGFNPESKDVPVKYHIKEVLPEGDDAKWKFESFEVSENGKNVQTIVQNSVEGTAKEGTSIKVIAKNKQETPNTGSLTINKTFEKKSNKDRKAQFKVKIEVPSDFSFSETPKNDDGDELYTRTTLRDGKTYYVLNNIAEIEIPGSEEQNSWSSGEFKWFGDYGDNIKYHVEEVQVLELEGNEWKDVTTEYNTPTSIDKPTGTFDGNVTIKATNKDNKENKNVIKLTKKREGITDGEEIFIFKVTVGNDTKYVALKAEQGHEEVTRYKIIESADADTNEGEWLNTTNGTWTSKEYTWLESEEVPEYTIEEVKVIAKRTYTPVITLPEGAESEVLDNGKGIKGKLDGSKDEIDVQAMNYANVDLKIKKVCVDDEGNPVNVSKKTTVKVNVYVKVPNGGFTDKPSVFEEKEIEGVKYLTRENIDLTIKEDNSESDIVGLGEFSWSDKDYNLYDEGNVIIKEVKIEGDTSFVFDEKDEKSVDVKSDNGLYFEIKNKKAKKHDKLSITKMLAEPADADEYFVFKINIAGETKYAAIKVEKDGKTGTQHVNLSSDSVDELKTVNWTVGGEWKSDEYYWFADEDAPTYTIEEVKAYKGSDYKDITGLYKPKMTPDNKGQLRGETLETKVDILNTIDYGTGPLTLKKKLSGNVSVTDNFKFKITIEPVGEMELIGANDGKKIVENVEIPAGGDITKNYKWKYTGSDKTATPKFTIEEIDLPNGVVLSEVEASNVDGFNRENNTNKISGYLKKNEIKSENDSANANQPQGVEVIVTNKITSKSGKIQVTKDFSSDKQINKTNAQEWAEKNKLVFTALVNIKAASGESFAYDGVIYKEKNIELKMMASNGWNAITDEIYWTGVNAPTFTIQEINIPVQFAYKKSKMDGNEIDNNQLTGTLKGNETIGATITNEPRSAVILTMELGGLVWEDNAINPDEKTGTDPNGNKVENYINVPNGIYDGEQQNSNDKPKANIEVNIFKEIYDENNNNNGHVLVGTTRTEKDGRWRLENIGVPVVTDKDREKLQLNDQNNYKAEYNVEFVYDGQTYKSVNALNYGIYNNKSLTGVNQGSVDDFKSEKDKYDKSSIATEIQNRKPIVEVKENTPMSVDGTTVGSVKYQGDSKEYPIIYKKSKDGYPFESTLQSTYGDNEYVYDVFKTTATTKETGIEYPFDEHFSLSEANQYLNTTYKDLLQYNSADDLIRVATKCWNDIVNGTLINGNSYNYAGTSIPPTSGNIDCSSFISYVLYNYDDRFKDEIKAYNSWQFSTIIFVDKNKLDYWKKNYGWEYYELKPFENANSVVQGGLQPGDIVVRDNGSGGSNGHITFIKDVQGSTYTLYDCGAKTNWAKSNINGLIVKNSNFIERDSRHGYVIRIGKNEPVQLINDSDIKYQISVLSNPIYDLYQEENNEYKKVQANEIGEGTYYLKNKSGDYVIDDVGNYIVPKDSGYIIVTKNSDGTFTASRDENFIIAETYKAIYNYCKNINLGLERKPDVDLALTKNITDATVVVREKLYKFNYSKYYDFTEENTDKLRKNITVNGTDDIVSLPVGLYKSDYNYRAEIYNSDSKVYDAKTELYKKFNKIIEDSEMDIYLNYEIKVQNSSSKYSATINSIDDYYDKTLTLVRAEEKKLVDGKEITVANAPNIGEWNDVEKDIVGSDGITYNKMKAENLKIDLEPGATETIKMTYKVNKDLYNANSIILGQKANVAEISSYSPTGGKIDRDSAPGNLNIREHNDKTWYEDDTFAAPIVDIKPVPSNSDDRTIDGTVWEDKRDVEEKDSNGNKTGYKYGNGKKGNDEKSVQGLTTELVEKVMIPKYEGNGTNEIESYTAYDFVIPTDMVLASLGNTTIEKATGFSSKTLTSTEGNYKFECVPIGDYVVRFTYGDKEIETAKYNEDNSSKFYNGQDYKSSIYPDVDPDVDPIPNVLDLSKYNNTTETIHSNVAVDSEVRRLQVIQNSREITNKNGKVLASSYDDKYAQYRDELFKDYYMYADTPIIRFDNDNSEELKKYNLKNIDFALEERPLTELSLDKQIKEILIKTSDGKTLMDAKYKIEYQVDEKGEIKASIKLDRDNSIGIDNLQALDRDNATTNGFRYINVDTEVLQGATITVTYQFAAINAGEVDYTSETLSKDDFDFNTSCEDLSKNLVKFDTNRNATNFSIGTYLGNHYYYGKGDNDVKVTTTVRELIDYVDNDVTFDALLNSTSNRSWKATTDDALNELTENTGKVIDSKGVEYSTTGNLITSTDDNENLKQKLTPVRNNNSYTPSAIIELTVSKFVSSDSDDLQIDNIAEIIRYTNTVGRRDILAVTGNTNPKAVLESKKPFDSSGKLSGGFVREIYERDTSSTETITLSPPTGSSIMVWKLQVAGVIAFSMAIIAGGILIIKKKVLK